MTSSYLIVSDAFLNAGPFLKPSYCGRCGILDLYSNDLPDTIDLSKPLVHVWPSQLQEYLAT